MKQGSSVVRTAVLVGGVALGAIAVAFVLYVAFVVGVLLFGGVQFG